MSIKRGAFLLSFLLLSLISLLSFSNNPSAFGQDKPGGGLAKRPVVTSGRDDESAINKSIQELSTAFNKSDVEALVGLWAEDGEFIGESGKIYRGKPALKVFFKKALEDFKGYKQSMKSDSIRFVRPEVALEEGTVVMTSPENEPTTGKYTSVWVKQDGRWLLSRVRDLPIQEAEQKVESSDKLKGLAWMLGEWMDKEGKGAVSMDCKWYPGQTFLLQDYVIKQADGKDFNVSYRIGWDPYNQQIRSWVFDSAGGFGIGWWTRDGNTWVIESEGVYPDGRLFSSTDTLKFIDENSAEWTSKNREVDEQPMPDIELKFSRKPKPR